MSGPVAIQALVTGLATGAAYGLIALGFSLVWRLTRTLAFAHGDIVTGAVFLGVLAVLGTTPVAAPLGAASTLALAVVTLVAGAALSIAVYALAIRPFAPRESAWGGPVVVRAGVAAPPGGDAPARVVSPGGATAPARRAAPGGGTAPALARLAAPALRQGALGWVAGGLAAGLLVRELLGLPFAQQSYALPDPLGSPGTIALGGGVTVPVRALEVLAIGLAVGIAVERVLAVTGAGAVMRAVADDAGAAALLGVPTERVVLVAFALAGALAGLAGLLIAPQAPIGLEDGVLLGLKAMAAALLFRLGSLRLAIAGGLVVGAAEGLILATPSLGAHWADVTILAALAALAALRR
jgi:branched-chain amino acid transport system permease protein